MDPTHRRRGRGRRVTAGPIMAAAVVLALAGCAPGGPVAPATTEPPAATTPAPSPTASEMPPASDAPISADADRPLEAIDAYALCRAQTYAYYPGDFALLDHAPFPDATVLLRDDGLWFVYIEVDDGNRPADLVDSSASNCIVGGTIGEPRWELFGVVARGRDVIDGYDRPLPTP
ncbi:hypothetical protein GCM10017608_26100 [Agromyces luteolus]|uniref:Lipoprotein n=1 Tax=Agromyces luteolus TaxID=88373 RepID=A0A7C9HK06_9MICO|nr:hypothetical protein [Agromyces luteolus]MUN08987.1 hypothetical protein [Agromyces luteolus]GLK28675.1 hypothetical protein GCM10017608_26100 [Agromyces luteolus]